MAYQYMYPNSGGHIKEKSFVVAILLAVFLGTFGVDRFYLGHFWFGAAKLLIAILSLGTLSWIWWVIDIILIATRKVDSSDFVWSDEARRGF